MSLVFAYLFHSVLLPLLSVYAIISLFNRIFKQFYYIFKFSGVYNYRKSCTKHFLYYIEHGYVYILLSRMLISEM